MSALGSLGWCFWTVVLEKTLESPLDCKEIQPVNPKGNQHWIFIGRTDAEAETPILWPRAAKNWLIWKDPDDGNDWRQEEKGTAEDKIVGWHHWLDGHEFDKAPEVGDGQGSLAYCSPWGHKELDMTEWLNWTDMRFSRQEYWSDLPFPSPVDYILSELSTMSHVSWVALHCMAHCFIELDKAVIHVISLVSFLSLWFSFCLPLPSEEIKSLSHVRLFATPWTVAYQAPLSMGFSRQ